MAAIVIGSAVEVAVRSTPWPAASVLLCVAVGLLLPWRRVRPLTVALAAFGAAAVIDLAAIVADVDWEGFYTAAFMLLVPYALGRWGTNRQVLLGAPAMAVPIVLAAVGGDPWSDVIGGAVVAAVAVELGVLIRYRTISNHQAIESSRSKEREQLARELHDTVAHHVSVIAVQAQAGRTLARRRPEAALEALDVIEEEASRALEQMRAMVGVLRDGRAADLAPQQGVADLARLASANGSLDVRVVIDPDVADLPPALDRAVYRIAQEAITNSIRHARNASTVMVEVEAHAGTLIVSVVDDGEPPRQTSTAGYGLAGMSERAKLLHGEFAAGPAPERGWQVRASFPIREGAAQ